MSIHLFAPNNSLNTQQQFKLPRLWFPNNPPMRISSKELHILVVRDLSSYSNISTDDMVQAVLRTGKKHNMVFLFDTIRIKILTPIPNLQSNELLTINAILVENNYFFPIEILPVICTYIGKPEDRISYANQRFARFLLDVSFSHLGNSIMKLVVEKNQIGKAMKKHGRIKFCERFNGNGNFARQMDWQVSSTFLEFSFLTSAKRVVPGYNYFQKPNSDLRFVSCGPRKLSNLAYYELYRAYDVYSWVSTILSFICVILVTKHIGNNLSMTSFVIKVLLEQGNPLSNRLLKHNISATLGVVIMLVGTALTHTKTPTFTIWFFRGPLYIENILSSYSS